MEQIEAGDRAQITSARRQLIHSTEIRAGRALRGPRGLFTPRDPDLSGRRAWAFSRVISPMHMLFSISATNGHDVPFTLHAILYTIYVSLPRLHDCRLPC